VTHRKLATHEVHGIDLRDLRRGAFFQREAGTIWFSRWTWGYSLTPHSEVAFFRVDDAERPVAVVMVPKTIETGWDVQIAYAIRLDWTPCNFGGARPWFLCGLVTGGKTCNSRARIIYKPYNALYFGCRGCWRLSYASRQRHRSVIAEGMSRLFAVVEALERTADPRCGTRRKIRALRRAEKAQPAIAALKRLGS
jgi:hypothetical protein